MSRATAWTGIAASLACTALLLAPGHGAGHGAELAGALLLACVPAGAAVMCWIESGDGFAQAGLTLVLSLAATAIFTAALIWLTAWHPRALFALPAVSVLSCAARLIRGTARG